MAGKSKHKRGKRYHPGSKKGKSRRHFTASITQQPAVTETHEDISQPIVSAPRITTPSPAAKAIARYPYITTELRTIGILAGIILIILTVLFFLLP